MLIIFKRCLKQVGGTEEVRGRMVFRGKISEETRAYIKFTKDMPVKDRKQVHERNENISITM